MPSSPDFPQTSRIASVSSQEHQHIRAGLAELEAGKGISNEHVMNWLETWGTENESPFIAS
jgi:predicted transcriptional regulator